MRLIEERNITQINNKLKENLHNYEINVNTIFEILIKARIFIENYYKNVYI
jgi:hypothetical protein